MVKIAQLPRDGALPQLDVLTDTSAMREVFQRRVPGFGVDALEILEIKIKRLSYKPGRKARVGYRLRVRPVDGPGEAFQYIFGVVNANGSAQTESPVPQSRSLVQPNFGPAVFSLPEMNMTLWGFPNDAKLSQLHQLVDEQAYADILRRNWSALGLAPGVELKRVETKPVKYVPLSRCTIRHNLILQGARDLTIYSKIFRKGIGAGRIYTTMQALRNGPAHDDAEIQIPEPLFYDAAMNAIHVRGVAGANASTCLDRMDLAEAAARIGRGLAKIHQTRIEGLPAAEDEEIHAKLQEAYDTLVGFAADYKPVMSTLIARLREQEPSDQDGQRSPIHGAFRLSQLLSGDGRFYMMDFEGFVHGDPVLDVASFVAHAIYMRLKGLIDQAQSQIIIERFCHAYASQAPWGLREDVLAWHTAAFLVGKQAKKCIKLAKRNYSSTIDRLLGIAGDILKGDMRLMGEERR